MPWIAAIAAVGSAAIGAATSAAQRDAANNALNNAMQQINAVGAPPDLAQQIVLQQFKQAGVLTPELAQTFQQGASQLNNYQNNQQTTQAQVAALQGLQARAQGGLTAEDRAAIANEVQGANQQIQSNRQAIIQSLQQRGQNTQGAEIAAQLAAAQAGGNQMANQGLQTAGLASQQALSALGQSGQLAGQMQAQQFSQAAQQAAAQNAINQFNTQNAQAIQNQNVAAQNQAQYYNVGNQQNLANANVSQQNAEAQREVQAQQQMYQDALQRAQAAASTALGVAPQYMAGANQQAQAWSNIGTGASGAINALNNQQIQQQSQPNVNNSSSSNPYNFQTASYQPFGSNSSGSSSAGSGQNYSLMNKGGIVGYSNGGTIEGEKPGNYTHLQPFDLAQVPGGHLDNGEIPQDYLQMNLQSDLPGYAHGGNILDANARHHIAAKNFALPGGRYPINDANHARNALARISQYGSPSEQAEVRAKVHAHYPNIQMQHKAHGGPIESCGMCSGGMAGYDMGGQIQDGCSAMYQGGEALAKHAHHLSEMLMGDGGKVPGRAKMAGDHPQNDTVPVMLSPGEVVVPKSKVDDPQAVKDFFSSLKKSFNQ